MDNAVDLPSSLNHEVLHSVPSQHMPPHSAVTMSSMSRRRRRSSVTGGGLRRSASTPNVRGMAGDGGLLMDKTKRNKLGYHRTSIACSMYILLSVIVSQYLRKLPRPLQTAQNTVFACVRRHATKMPELHQAEEGLQFSPSRSASPRGATASHEISSRSQIWRDIWIFFVSTAACRWPPDQPCRRVQPFSAVAAVGSGISSVTHVLECQLRIPSKQRYVLDIDLFTSFWCPLTCNSAL